MHFIATAWYRLDTGHCGKVCSVGTCKPRPTTDEQWKTARIRLGDDLRKMAAGVNGVDVSRIEIRCLGVLLLERIGYG